jgi:hypothetical protein
MNLNRSETAKLSWVARRSTAARIQRWYERPVCLCGCEQRLERAESGPGDQRLFRMGHDSRLKSLLAAVLRGDKRPSEIPVNARLMRRRIGFLKTNPDLAKVFSTFRMVRND